MYEVKSWGFCLGRVKDLLILFIAVLSTACFVPSDNHYHTFILTPKYLSVIPPITGTCLGHNS